MILKKIVEAFGGVCSMCKIKCSAEDALKIARLAKKMSFYAESFCAEERKLLTLYCEHNEKGEPLIENGVPRFKSPKDKEEYIKEREALLACEAEDIVPLKLDLKALRLTDGSLSAGELLAMSGIIDIEEE